MIKVSVIYPAGAGAKFDMAYYLTTHMPTVQKKAGAALESIQVDEGLGGFPPGSPAPYLAMGHLVFESMDAFSAMIAAHGAWIQADMPNYTNTQPVIQISQVKM